jgi:hypothetical protein
MCVLTLAQAIGQAETIASVRWLPEKLANGSPCLFTVRVTGARLVSGVWQNHKLEFAREPASDVWDVLAGIDIETKPGIYPLTISITFTDGTSQRLEQTISVEEAPYKSTTLSVPDRFVAPDPVALKRVAADRVVKEKAFAHTASLPLWSGSFKPPLHSAPSTDSFGTRRVFNGSLASVHRGLDYRAKKSTPVAAVNSGRIILARPLYYEGNCVVVDHGQGLMTLYMHLSRFKIAEGARVKRGQIIGLSGATGRATGPHLHLGVRWQGAYLDASKLFAIDLPMLPYPKH